MRNDANYKNVRLRWLGAPGLLACVAAAAGACSSDQSMESIGYTDQAAEASTVLLSEIQYRPNTTAPHRYIELTGTPAGTLDGYYVLFVDGRVAGSPGAVLKAIDLGAECGGVCALGSNGMLVIVSSSTGGFSYPSATTVVASGYTMPGSTGAGTDDYSILLVKSTVAINTSTDFDSANNGTLTIPSGVTIADAVGWTESTNGYVYGGADVSRPKAGTAQAAPQTIIRIDGVTSVKTPNAWFTADTANTGASTIDLDTTTIRATGTTPAPTGVTKLTPGLANTAANVALEGTAGAAGAAGAHSGGAAGHAGSSSVLGGGTAGASFNTTAGTTNGGAAAGAGTTITDTAGSAGTLVVVINGGTTSTGGAPIVLGGTAGIAAVGAGAPAVTGGAPVVTGGAPATTAQAGSAGLTAVAPTSGGATVTSAGQPGVAGQPIEAAGASTKGGASATGGTKATGGSTVVAAGNSAKTGGASSTTTTPKAGAANTGKGGAATSSSSTEEDEEESSCGCRVAGKNQSTGTGFAAMLALAGALLSRRRRRN